MYNFIGPVLVSSRGLLNPATALGCKTRRLGPPFFLVSQPPASLYRAYPDSSLVPFLVSEDGALAFDASQPVSVSDSEVVNLRICKQNHDEWRWGVMCVDRSVFGDK